MTTVTIPLSKGRVAVIDSADSEWLRWIGRWCYSRSGYAVHYHADDDGQHKTLYMHRLIMERQLGHAIARGLQVDHVNMDRLDNSRANLRLATRSQNQAHKSVPINNTSAYKGVSWNHDKWEARIKYGVRRLHLGRFGQALDAALMYDAASRRLYQDFAGCNFPEIATPSSIADQLNVRMKHYGLS